MFCNLDLRDSRYAQSLSVFPGSSYLLYAAQSGFRFLLYALVFDHGNISIEKLRRYIRLVVDLRWAML